MATANRKKNYLEITAAELAAETARFDNDVEIEDLTAFRQAASAMGAGETKRGGLELVPARKLLTQYRHRYFIAEGRSTGRDPGISRAKPFSASLVALMAGEAAHAPEQVS